MMELARRSLCKTFAASDRDLQGRLVYDVCHNIAKLEVHEVNGVRRRVCVHRKGATRAFPGSRSEVPAAYRGAGQPVLVPGDMGTASYVCAGTDTALAETFGSACHGAGRAMSRSQSKKRHDPATLLRELGEQGVVVLARSKKTVAEEASGAYKDVHAVVDVTDRAGIARRVARIRPMAVIKG
jgi:tRNA-splicing ligase RtcB